MNTMFQNKSSFFNNPRRSDTIHTNLYDLIDAVMSSAKPEEGHMTNFIVSEILDAGNVRLPRALAENIGE